MDKNGSEKLSTIESIEIVHNFPFVPETTTFQDGTIGSNGVYDRFIFSQGSLTRCWERRKQGTL